jgi:hypothetical protein
MGSEPKTLDEALASPNAKEWQAAYDYEINQLLKMGVFAAEDLPEGETAIPYGLVFKEKCGPDGDVESHRVRLVAGGHRQREGVNYDETFSSAAKSPTVRAVLGHAASKDWEIEQVDVKSAYLYAPLKEKVYMKAPPGILKPGEEGKVLRVLKCLYGLKQAGRGWYKEMSRVFTTELGFTRSAVDHSIFYRRSGEEHTVIAVATDDMALTSKRRIDIEKLKEEISRHWDISDKGELSWYLGFEVKQNRAARTISINQYSYIEQMTEKFRLTNAKPVSTPMEPGAQFTKEQGPSTPTQMMRMRNVPYAEAIGSVLWPVMISRPDAAFSVSVLS